jgi:uncharacterized protein with HEPN domain
MRNDRADRLRLLHMQEAIEEIESYLNGVDFESFVRDSMVRFACIKQLEIIGEASNHVSENTKLRFTFVEWNQLRGLRNVLVHEYFGVDVKVIWDILIWDLQPLKQKIGRMLLELE